MTGPTQLYGRTHASRMLGVSMQTLIIYEQRGIVSPQRDSSGKRLYSDADIQSARHHLQISALNAAKKRVGRVRGA